MIVDEFALVLELVQLVVERVAERLVLLAEAEATAAEHLFAVLVDRRERLGGLEAVEHVGLLLHGEVGAGDRVDPAGLESVVLGVDVREQLDLVVGDAGGVGVADLDRTLEDGDGHVAGCRRPTGSRVEAVRVALGTANASPHAVVGIGEQDLLGTLGVDVHAGGDHVELPGLETRDQGAEVDDGGLDVVDAELAEDGLGDLGGLAGDVAVLVLVPVGHLVGDADLDGALVLELGEEAGGLLAVARGGGRVTRGGGRVTGARVVVVTACGSDEREREHQGEDPQPTAAGSGHCGGRHFCSCFSRGYSGASPMTCTGPARWLRGWRSPGPRWIDPVPNAGPLRRLGTSSPV